MSEWVSDSEITAKLGYKILLAGLSEAGKTACKRIFFLKQKTETVDSLSATINYERMSVTIKGTPINIVDLGGQKVFLNRFLSSFSPFVFSSVKIFIFLIDVANKTTRNNAISYFSACRDRLDNYSPNSKVFVFLHKNDLLRNSPNYESIHEQLKEQFQMEYPNEEILFFRTTIYKPETITNAFGRIFELVMPELAKSDFVDGNTIGSIEEFAKQAITIRERTIKDKLPPIGTTTQETLPMANYKTEAGDMTKAQSYQARMAGDPIVLNKLQKLMRQATNETSPPEPQEPEVLDKLQRLMRQATHKTSTSKAEISINKPSEILESDSEREEKVSIIKLEDSEEITSEKEEIIETAQLEPKTAQEIDDLDKTDSEMKLETKEVNQLIRHLMDFYGLELEHAEGIVKKGYHDLFEIIAATGIIDTSLVTNVLLKYIPFIQSKGLQIENLTNERLLDIFIALLNRWVLEDDAIKFIIFAVERPSLSIKEIIEEYFVKPKIKAIRSDKVKVKELKPRDLAKIDIPVETKSVAGIIRIPGTPLGFKIIKDNLNIGITIYSFGQNDEEREEIGHSTVSATVSVSELIYLIAYELNMVDLGFFEGGKESLEFCAKIIHEAIKQLEEGKITPLEQIEGEKADISTTFNFIVPTEMEMNGDFIKLPDSQDVAFTLEKHKQGFKISFMQRGFPIGSTIIDDTYTIETINQLLQEKMQIPLESDGARIFAARIIHAALNTFLVASKISDSRKEPIKLEVPKISPEKIKEEDETSEHLKYYLDLLEKE